MKAKKYLETIGCYGQEKYQEIDEFEDRFKLETCSHDSCSKDLFYYGAKKQGDIIWEHFCCKVCGKKIALRHHSKFSNW